MKTQESLQPLKLTRRSPQLPTEVSRRIRRTCTRHKHLEIPDSTHNRNQNKDLLMDESDQTFKGNFRDNYETALNGVKDLSKL
jgi:hypothetical protein